MELAGGGENDACPGRILVGEATREWSLRVDEKLAHRLQEEEINKHLDGNRHRNEIVRQSYPVAASLQQMVLEEANKKASLMQQRIETDARIAKEQQKLELHKAGVKSKEGRTKRGNSYQPPLPAIPMLEEVEAGPSTSQHASNNGAIPRRPPTLRTPKSYSVDMGYDMHPNREDPMDSNSNLAELEAALGVSKEQLNLEKARLLQEEKDAELARQLLSTEIRDPIEIADGELARRLQDREYERYQKSKEKRALRKQMEKMNSSRASHQQEAVLAPELNDTYSQPHDSLRDTSAPLDHFVTAPGNNRLDMSQSSHSQHNNNTNTNNSLNQQQYQQEDPYYMEPIHTSDPVFLNSLNIHNNNTDVRNNNNNSHHSNTNSSTGSGGRPYSITQGAVEHKRAPPAPPKPLGRPRLAEPEPRTGSLKSNEDKDKSKARCRQM